jgi:hypothetical protein
VNVEPWSRSASLSEVVVVEGVVIEETASRSLVSHAIQADLSTSFVPDGKAKRSWQWEDEDRMDNELTAFQWAKALRVRYWGTCSRGRQRCRKESAGFRALPLIGLFADATTLREPLQALAESWPLRPR